MISRQFAGSRLRARRAASSGRQTMLPHYLPAGQVYQTGGQTYAQDASGTYWRLENNAWTRMNAGQ